MRTETTIEKDDSEGLTAFIYTLRAGRIFRGHISREFRVYEENSSGRAAFDWTAGREYLLFLSYSDAHKAWELDGCGNSGPLSQVKAVLKQIYAIRIRRGNGVIQGVVSQQALSFPIAGVHVEAEGANGAYTATTNATGEFEIKVPPGRYYLRATKAGLGFVKADFSYEDPDDLRVQPGGCVQVQLVQVQLPAR